MLFKDIKPNYPVYILDKQEVTLIQGKATNISFPRMQMTQSGTQMVIDVTIEADGRSATYSIPDHSEITYAGNLVLATDKSLLVKEVEAINDEAEQALNSIEKRKEQRQRSSDLLIELNPAFKEKKETEERFNKIESSVSEMKDLITNFIKEFKS